MDRIMLEPKGEMSLKAVPEAININSLIEIFDLGCPKSTNGWEQKESSKRIIIFELVLSLLFWPLWGTR